MKKFSALLAAAIIGASSYTAMASDERIFQVSTLQALAQGYYYGAISVADLARRGDIGIGTFEGLDGEMIVLDGVVYQALADSRVAVPDGSVGVPYATVTRFDSDLKVRLKDIRTFAELTRDLTRVADAHGKNSFYAVRIDGRFRTVRARSERAQSEPYLPLAETLERDQTTFDLSDVEGTLVGLYCPTFMQGLNVPGWHLHFITADRTRGGHLFEADIESAVAQFDITPGCELMIPKDDARFHALELGREMTSEIERAEKESQ